MISILIADDHSVVRRGLCQILTEGFPDSTVDEAIDGNSIIEKIKQRKYDIVISDLSMPGRTGLDVIVHLKLIQPKVPVLILSIHPEDQYALRVLNAGASGYLSKDLAPEELVEAVRTVLKGEKYMPPEISQKLLSKNIPSNSKPAHSYLSDREFEVMKMLALGNSISEIANLMLLSSTTVSTYRARILTKMNFNNNADIVLYSMKNNLIQD